MKKINAARAISFFKQPFIDAKRRKADLEFANLKRAELEKLKTPCEEFFWKVAKPFEFRQFETSTKEVFEFAEYFIQETVEDPELQNKLLTNLNDFKFVGTKPEAFVTKMNFNGACGCKVVNGQFSIEKWACLGNIDKDSILKTNFQRIRTLLHETAHATSQKYDLDNFVNKLDIDKNIIEQDPQKAISIYGNSIKDHNIGEIESLFMEKVFRHFLATKSDKVVADGMNFGLSAEQIEQQAYNLQLDEQGSFLSHVDFINRPKHNKHMLKNYIFRYVVGEVGARILFEKYLENPNEALKIYGEFLKTNAQLDIDEAVQMISDGEIKTYGVPKEITGENNAMDVYQKIFEDKIKKLNAKGKNSKQNNYEMEESN